MKMRDTVTSDFYDCKSEERLTAEEILSVMYNDQYHLRTIYTDDIVHSIFMVYDDGEIGMLINNSSITSTHKFFTLSIVFIAEAFAHTTGEDLWAQVPDNKRNILWAKHLGFKPSRHAGGYMLPLHDWVT